MLPMQPVPRDLLVFIRLLTQHPGEPLLLMGHTFQPCFSVLALEERVLAPEQESDQLIWKPNLNFWGSLGFGSLSWCEIAFGAGLEFLFLPACWGLPVWGKDMQMCVQAHPKFRAIHPILPQILLSGEQGWSSTRTAADL